MSNFCKQDSQDSSAVALIKNDSASTNLGEDHLNRLIFALTLLVVLISCGGNLSESRVNHLNKESNQVACKTTLAQKWHQELSRYDDYNNSNDSDDLLPPLGPLREAASSYHLVLVAGFFNETFPEYFLDNVQSLREDFGTKKITLIFPSSREDTSDNAIRLYSEILNSYKSNGQRPLIIVAHSKGAVELLQVMFKNPELIEQKVISKAILIQAGIGGSPIADVASDALWLLSPFVADGWGGLASLRSGHAKQVLRKLYDELSPNERTAVSQVISFARSGQHTRETTPLLKLTQIYLEHFFGLNDGLLLTEDQFFYDVGADLGVLDSDHSDLVFSENESLTSPKSRYAFTRALIRQIFEPF